MDMVQLVNFLQVHKLRLVTAESCTAGLMASTVADVEGAGELLDCAFVTYSPQAKQKCLGVRAETIAEFGLTSEQVAREMALGALKGGFANLAVANTGVADSVDPDIPSGTQCYAWAFASPGRAPFVHSETRRFGGDRNRIRRDSARYALYQIPVLWQQFADRSE
jgi:nicotinamide-nucleotide amidase